MENGSCSAAFCESAALRKSFLLTFSGLNPLRRSRASSPKGTPKLPQSKPDGFDSSLWEGAFGMAIQFLAEVQSLRACPLPLGGAVAQRLRGF